MNSISCISLLCSLSFLLGAAKTGYVRHADPEFNYSISIPSGWKKSSMTFENTRMLVLSRGDRTDITISAIRSDSGETDRLDAWQGGYIKKGIKGRVLKVIETREIELGGNIIGRLLVIEYTTGGRRILQRSLVLKNSSTMVLIECRAPTRNFSRYTDVFDTLMESISFYGVAVPVAPSPAAEKKETKPAETAETVVKEEIKNEEREIDLQAYMDTELNVIRKLEKLGIIQRME